LRGARDTVRRLLEDADRGIIEREGVRVAIVGRPNVGKSSLLNALLHAERAIVTPIAGTTRDTLEETVNLGGVPVVLVDTAGIAGDSADTIERLGIERSRRAVVGADVCLLVIDGSEPLTEEDLGVAALTAARRTILVVNKADLLQRAVLSQCAPEAQRVWVSARTGAGLPQLEGAVVEAALGGPVGEATPLVASQRHQDALRRAGDALVLALGALDEGRPWDLVCIDVRTAVEALGEITGETVGEELLHTIFSRFCIGK
jgi:tRNA modification GTPase